MTINDLIPTLLQQTVFVEKPLVLIDVGASGEVHAEWKSIAKYAHCIAFDADSRDFQTETNNSEFKKLYLINAIVSDKEDAKTKFYLTKSPYCSSALAPIDSELSNWSFSGLFEIEKEIDLDNKSLKTVISEKQIEYVDWFKTDSQGIDLRLFKNLPTSIQKNMIVAEFEPGFIDAYKNEDKIADLLVHLETLPFWLSDCEVKGSQRINKATIAKHGLNPSSLNLRTSSCWAEFTYINTCENLDKRQLLAAIVFCLIKKQYGFVLDICVMLEGKIEASLLQSIEKLMLAELTKQPEKPSILSRIKSRLLS
jgi:FkbM family methyltransferase